MQRRRIGCGGPTIASLGFGTAPIGGFHDLMTEAAASQTVAAALRGGIDWFDTGPLLGMGLAEHRLGTALREAQGEHLVAIRVGNLLRSGLVAGSAEGGFRDGLGFQPVSDYSRGGLLRAFEDAQQRLGLPRLDILVIDDPLGPDRPAALRQLLDSGFAALAELREEALISAIGCAISAPELAIEVVLGCDLDLVLIPGQYTLLDQTATRMLDLCAQRGLSAMVTSPFNSGILASRPRRGALCNGAEAAEAVLAKARRLDAICASHGVPLPAAALQFPLTRPEVVCVIAGMASPEEVAQNIALMRHPIPAELWADLAFEELILDRAALPA